MPSLCTAGKRTMAAHYLLSDLLKLSFQHTLNTTTNTIVWPYLCEPVLQGSLNLNQAVVKKTTDEGSVRFAVGSTHLYWNRSREEEQVFELKQSEEMFRSRLSWSVVKSELRRRQACRRTDSISLLWRLQQHSNWKNISSESME